MQVKEYLKDSVENEISLCKYMPEGDEVLGGME